MSPATAKAGSGHTADAVRKVFAQVTRYPWEILEPTASLEEDLGIDSVKLGEVFAVLREKYSLSDKIEIPREKLRTISSISEALEEHLDKQPREGTIPAPSVREGIALAAAGHPADIGFEVRKVFASVTRYPLDILEPGASLEEDLGIDSVKLGEVFAILRERYHLPEKLDMPREQIKTIAGISESLARYLQHAADQAPAPAPVILNGNGVSAKAPASPENLTENLRAVFAEVTRYPLDILDPSASLEEDLGIDSVKLGEILAVLRERYSLPADVEVPREKLKTISGISDALRAYLDRETSRPTFQESTNGKVVHNGSAGARHSATIEKSFAALNAQKKPFEGKIALISGSGRGLGKDIAVYLAELGASVVVNSFHSRSQGIQTVEEITAAGGKALHAWGSVANPEHLSSIFDLVEQTYGGLDFFISNASNGMLARLNDITVEHWEKAFRTNVVGLHQSALRAVQLMKKRGGGKIVTLSSPASHGYVDYFGCMGTVKAAVESLTKSMAIEFAPDNIQVNCVSPGPIYGELLDKWPESKRLIAEWEQATVCDRLCEARDVSHFVAYLLSDSVKLFTGSVLVMDGGISVRWG